MTKIITGKEETDRLLSAIEALHNHLDAFSQTLFCELEVIRLKLNRIITEVVPPK